MSMTITEAARAKRVSRNAIWLAIGRNKLPARRTSGGIWLIDEGEEWRRYEPRRDTKQCKRSQEQMEETNTNGIA